MMQIFSQFRIIGLHVEARAKPGIYVHSSRRQALEEQG